MAVKSIVDIEVNDAPFRRFQALYDRYQTALKQSPEEWAKVTDKIGRTRKEFDQIVKQQIAVQAKTKLIAEAQREAERLTRTTSERWRDMSRTTREVASNVASMTGNLLRWSAISGVISGLLGAGGLFGIDRLAGSVASTRRFSLGTGAGYGATRSFGVNFGRLVEPDSFLSSVSGAKTDVTRRTGLIGAGLSEQEINADTGTTAVALLRNLKRIADVTTPALYAQVIAARQLGQFVSPEDLQRLRNTPGKEFSELVRAHGADTKGFSVSADTSVAWQNFVTQMRRAGEGIENTFVKGLVRLEPALERLSASFEKVVRAFGESDAVKNLIDKIGDGLDKFASYVGTDKFQNDVRSFAEGVGKIASAIGKAVAWIAGNTRFGAEGNPDWDAKEANRKYQQQQDSAQGKSPAWESFKRIFSAGDTENYIREAAKKRGLDPEVAVAVARSEGLAKYHGDFDATGKPTSFGPFQLHYSGTGRFTNSGLGEQFTKYTGFDARDPNTTKQQVDFALDYAKANGWGPWHGWKGSPNAGGAGVKVTIENNTGGSAIVTTNQVAQ